MNPSYLVGNRLREERERLGLTQAEAGALVGVSREMWGKYERGALPGGEVLVSLGSGEMDILYILTGQRSQPVESRLSRAQQALLANYEAASQEGRRLIESTAKMACQVSCVDANDLPAKLRA